MTIVWVDGTWIRGKDGLPRVILFGRKYDNSQETVQTAVKGFRPYFYVPAGSSVHAPDVEVDDEVVVDALGRRVRKVYTKLPSDVRRARQYYEWTDEADVFFDMRFVIDAHIRYAYRTDNGRVEPVDVPHPIKPRILYFDIEVRSPAEIMPKPEKPDWPIVTIQCLDSYTGEIKVFTFDIPHIRDEQVACASEREMLIRFSEYVQKIDPDVITGWYSNGFDIPYLVRRATKLGIQLPQLTRLPHLSSPRVSPGRQPTDWRIRIVGRQCVDMLEAFKKWYKAEGELETYDLKYIAKRFANFEYEDYGDRIDELMTTEQYDVLLDYCISDVKALKAIDDAIELFDFYEYLRYVTGVKLEDTLKNSRMIETLLMRAGIKPMPTRVFGEEGDRYSGALVLEPPIGIHEWVGVFDLASLYPTIIMAFDVSPDIDKMIPKVITTILQEREKLRKLRLEGKADDSTKKKEVVLKFIANSFYGVLGWTGFRLYNRELAEFITTKGREINRMLQQWAREQGYEPIYGDTDSVFIKGITSPDRGLHLQDYFNERLVEWSRDVGAKIPPTIKFEKLFRRVMFKKRISGEGTAKKRYAGWLIWEDGHAVDKIKIVGLETKRSDSAELTKELMEQFFEIVLRSDHPEAAGKLIRDALRNFDKYPLQKIAIPKGVKKDLDDYKNESAWIAGIRNAQQLLGLRFRQDRKPRLLYLKRPVTRLCITEDVDTLPDGYEIDWDTMKDRVIVKKFRPLLESIGLSWDVIVKGQQTLDAWW